MFVLGITRAASVLDSISGEIPEFKVKVNMVAPEMDTL